MIHHKKDATFKPVKKAIWKNKSLHEYYLL